MLKVVRLFLDSHTHRLALHDRCGSYQLQRCGVHHLIENC